MRHPRAVQPVPEALDGRGLALLAGCLVGALVGPARIRFGGVIAVGRHLIPVGCALVAVGAGLIRVRRGLVRVRQRLVKVGQRLVPVGRRLVGIRTRRIAHSLCIHSRSPRTRRRAHADCTRSFIVRRKDPNVREECCTAMKTRTTLAAGLYPLRLLGSTTFVSQNSLMHDTRPWNASSCRGLLT